MILGTDQRALRCARTHERVHVRQYERWGPLFFALYVGSSLAQWLRGRHPYFDNCFEREAYACAAAEGDGMAMAMAKANRTRKDVDDAGTAKLLVSRQAIRLGMGISGNLAGMDGDRRLRPSRRRRCDRDRAC